MTASMFERFLAPAEITDVFSDAAMVQAMLRFEAALARAQADEGVIPRPAAQAIVGVCKAELYDIGEIVGQSGRAGSLAIPLVRKLTETVALFDREASGYVHWGSTSQDVIDTAMVLLTRNALALIERDLRGLILALLDLAERHLDTPMLGRTLMQPAQVITLGFKAIGWAAPKSTAIKSGTATPTSGTTSRPTPSWLTSRASIARSKSKPRRASANRNGTSRAGPSATCARR